MNNYEELKAKVQQLVQEGRLSGTPTREERIDFAYGNTKIENDAITLDMIERAADRLG